jgi:glycosyltransferase involved in cell wall biosynthesis
MTDEKFVLDLYLHLLGRDPDPDGVKHWTGVLATRVSRSDVLELFMSSPEFLSLREARERRRGLPPEFTHLTVPEQEILVRLQERVAEWEEGYPEAQKPATRNGRFPKASGPATVSARQRVAPNVENDRTEFAACTIIAKNYLPMARVLSDSWMKFHPDCPFFVLLLDSARGFFSPEDENVRILFASDLGIPNLDGFLFKYSILEASTGVKPYLCNYLLRRHNIDKLLYLDPDILILNSLDSLRHYLDDANILLTPHLLSPFPDDGRTQSEHDILQAGTYNLGFLALRNNLESKKFLHWWSAKLYHHCLAAVENNLFVDQRWMDMVPALFDGVKIIREPDYNVAYWNLHERVVSVGDQVLANGRPLRFFHFSGFDADSPWIVSKHQDRFSMTSIGEAYKLYIRYRNLLVEKGWDQAKGWKYTHDYFYNGVKIPPSARRYYWGLGTHVSHLGDPFSWLDPLSTAGDSDPVTADLEYGGVNLMGYFESETGVGESARSNLRIIRAAGIPYVLNNVIDLTSKNIEAQPELFKDNNPFAVNLLNINADQLPAYGAEYPNYLKGRFNIGYWAWELPEFPEIWARSFGYTDEVWTPSNFTRDSVASRSPVPVRVVPHAMDPVFMKQWPVDRSKFQISPEVFVFAFFFDFHSYLERKNPLRLIEAYKKAFGNRKDVELLIKSSHGLDHPVEFDAVKAASVGAHVRLMDCVLTREEKYELMMACDCYVSLHRSEGFGLTLAEAMMCSKPVIATAYSGNMDFMSDEHSLLVPYRLIPIEGRHGPYMAGSHWADPDLDFAVDAMRQVESCRETSAELGRRARASICVRLHPATIAIGVRDRLKELELLH